MWHVQAFTIVHLHAQPTHFRLWISHLTFKLAAIVCAVLILTFLQITVGSFTAKIEENQQMGAIITKGCGDLVCIHGSHRYGKCWINGNYRVIINEQKKISSNKWVATLVRWIVLVCRFYGNWFAFGFVAFRHIFLKQHQSLWKKNTNTQLDFIISSVHEARKCNTCILQLVDKDMNRNLNVATDYVDSLYVWFGKKETIFIIRRVNETYRDVVAKPIETMCDVCLLLLSLVLSMNHRAEYFINNWGSN